MSVSSSPRGEHPGRPGTTWDTELRYVETIVPDRDGDNESPFGWGEPRPADYEPTTLTPTAPPEPSPNRAARRAAARAARRNQ